MNYTYIERRRYQHLRIVDALDNGFNMCVSCSQLSKHKVNGARVAFRYASLCYICKKRMQWLEDREYACDRGNHGYYGLSYHWRLTKLYTHRIIQLHDKQKMKKIIDLTYNDNESPSKTTKPSKNPDPQPKRITLIDLTEDSDSESVVSDKTEVFTDSDLDNSDLIPSDHEPTDQADSQLFDDSASDDVQSDIETRLENTPRLEILDNRLVMTGWGSNQPLKRPRQRKYPSLHLYN